VSVGRCRGSLYLAEVDWGEFREAVCVGSNKKLLKEAANKIIETKYGGVVATSAILVSKVVFIDDQPPNNHDTTNVDYYKRVPRSTRGRGSQKRNKRDDGSGS
jgi:hypothetical protein